MSVPVAPEDAVYFNAHRVFSPKTIINSFNEMELLEFSYIHDYKITTYKNEEAKKIIKQGNYTLSDYDCGIFILKKLNE